MERYLYQIAEMTQQINQRAYDTYLPLVEDVCSRRVSEEELSYLLDYLLDFAGDKKMLDLYKRVCKNYIYIYIRLALSFILKHIERCGELKKNSC